MYERPSRNTPTVSTVTMSTIQQQKPARSRLEREDGLTRRQTAVCLRMVKKALDECNPGRAKAAIDFAFCQNEKPAAVDLDTHICNIGLRPDTWNMLENAGISSVGQLADATESRLINIRGFGQSRVQDVRDALQRIRQDWID